MLHGIILGLMFFLAIWKLAELLGFLKKPKDLREQALTIATPVILVWATSYTKKLKEHGRDYETPTAMEYTETMEELKSFLEEMPVEINAETLKNLAGALEKNIEK